MYRIMSDDRQLFIHKLKKYRSKLVTSGSDAERTVYAEKIRKYEGRLGKGEVGTLVGGMMGETEQDELLDTLSNIKSILPDIKNQIITYVQSTNPQINIENADPDEILSNLGQDVYDDVKIQKLLYMFVLIYKFDDHIEKFIDVVRSSINTISQSVIDAISVMFDGLIVQLNKAVISYELLNIDSLASLLSQINDINGLLKGKENVEELLLSDGLQKKATELMNALNEFYDYLSQSQPSKHEGELLGHKDEPPHKSSEEYKFEHQILEEKGEYKQSSLSEDSYGSEALITKSSQLLEKTNDLNENDVLNLDASVGKLKQYIMKIVQVLRSTREENLERMEENTKQLKSLIERFMGQGDTPIDLNVLQDAVGKFENATSGVQQ